MEEQFYLLWPLMLLVVGAVAVRRRRSQFGLMLVVAAVSLAYSVYAIAANPSATYFDTFARFWEFALGGILALLWTSYRIRPFAAAALGWTGLALICYSAVSFSGDTTFPGWAALVPVAGTLAVIGSRDSSTWWGPHGIFSLAPTKFVGDISYSIYLWHWPMIVLWPAVVGSKLNSHTKLLLLVAAVVVGFLSKILIEDRFRGSRGDAAPTVPRHAARGALRIGQPAYVWLVVAMIPILAVAGAGWWSLQAPVASARTALADLQRDPPQCYGGEVMSGAKAGCSPSTATLRTVVPSPLIASAGFEASNCQQRATRSDVETCVFGSTAAGATPIALVGDSHATQWLPALAQLASANGWRLTTYLMSGCVLSSAGPVEKCREWNRRVLGTLRTVKYRFVLVSGRSLSGLTSLSAVSRTASAIAKAWTQVIQAGSQVVAIQDVPQPVNAGRGDVPTCVYNHSNPAACGFDQTRGERYDLVHVAAKSAPGVHLVDMNRYFCASGTCAAVIGNVLVYLDDKHMTSTYSQSLTGPLLQELQTAGLAANAR